MFFFSIMDFLFPILFLFVIGLVILTFIRQIAQWNQNNHSPRLTVEAMVVTKRRHTVHYQHGMSTSYYVTFQVESGDRMELHLPGPEYGLLAEGDWGWLSFQGTRYLGFDRFPAGEDYSGEDYPAE